MEWYAIYKYSSEVKCNQKSTWSYLKWETKRFSQNNI